MKKLLFFAAIFFMFTMNAQKKATTIIDCSKQLPQIIKNTAETYSQTVYSYKVISFKKESISTAELISNTSLLYKKMALDALKEGNAAFTNNRSLFETNQKLAADYTNRYQVLDAISENYDWDKKDYIVYTTQFNQKTENSKNSGDFESKFYFTKKCVHLPMDQMYDYIIDNLNK